MSRFHKGVYGQILELALKGYTAAYIAERLNLDIIAVTDVMPTADERNDMREAIKNGDLRLEDV